MDRFEVFCGSVMELNRYLQKLKEIEMRAFGLRAGHVMCLYQLGKNPEGLTATELTEACKEDKAAISRTVAQLTGQGYVSSTQAEGRRAYRTRLFLTEKGRELVRSVDHRVDAALTSGGNGLTDAQRETFYSTMDLIIQNLSRYLAEKEQITEEETI